MIVNPDWDIGLALFPLVILIMDWWRMKKNEENDENKRW